jgi:hypothetical protein
VPRAKVTLNQAGVAELLKSPEVAADLQRRAEAVAAVARGSVPTETGRARDSIHVEMDETDRAVARVVMDPVNPETGESYGAILEAATGTLASALDAARGA